MIKDLTIYLILSLSGTILIGCATAPPKALFLKPGFEHKQLESIAVLPVEDVGIVKGEKPKLEELLIKALHKRGYLVPEIDEIEERLQKVGITGDAVYNTDPKKLCNILGVEAVLKSRLHDYETSYKVLYRTDRLEMHFTLYSGENGEVLWEDHLAKHKTYVGGIVGSAFGGTIEYWITTGFYSLPAGKNWSPIKAINW